MVHPHTANFVSITRIPASLVLLATYQPGSQFHVVAAIGISLFVISSDLLDGKIARKYKIESELGYILDGLGDRAFHVAAYLLFLTSGLIGVFLVWLLILREISQYAVRLTEIGWHATQSFADRLITRCYTITVHGLLLFTFGRELIAPNWNLANYQLGANVLLFCAVLVSYSRIAPRLWQAWLRAING